jgi:hypothetical protein
MINIFSLNDQVPHKKRQFTNHSIDAIKKNFPDHDNNYHITSLSLYPIITFTAGLGFMFSCLGFSYTIAKKLELFRQIYGTSTLGAVTATALIGLKVYREKQMAKTLKSILSTKHHQYTAKKPLNLSWSEYFT